ncbi:MAG: plasmid recombination protein [Clostridiales bacterium]|nr:plasmid recombination protein [Clostridiales bacterium]
MARNDGVDRTSVRNANLKKEEIGDVQRHNEREKDSYSNPDIIPERTPLNVHFKEPCSSYHEIFDTMLEEKMISTRGLKADASVFGELVFDVNSSYFFNHGGYEYAKQFYSDAYQAAIEIVGGEQYILSAVMHADERNRAMSEALGQDIFHYHLHVVYIPVVEKQILWSKRCKDKSLVGTVKETIMQVSSSKKWLSKPALDESGAPILRVDGKPVLKKSYSVLQDDFFNYMKAAGYADVERGERGSSEEHLTVTQFKVMKETERLEDLEEQIEESGVTLAQIHDQIESGNETLRQVEHDTRKAEDAADAAGKKLADMEKKAGAQARLFREVDGMGKKNLAGNIMFTPAEAGELKSMAKKGIAAGRRISELEERAARAEKDARIWKRRYEKLLGQVQDYLAAVKKAPERVAGFLRSLLAEKNLPQQRHPERAHRKDVEL